MRFTGKFVGSFAVRTPSIVQQLVEFAVAVIVPFAILQIINHGKRFGRLISLSH
jgi:hypothetical protein